MDDDAWQAFCRLYAPNLTSFVRVYFGCDAEQAEEIIQMTFVRCVRSIRTFDSARGRLADWLKGIARNEGITCLARSRRPGEAVQWSQASMEARQGLVKLIDQQPLPQEMLARQDMRELVQGCLAALSERHRQALVMKYLEGLKVADIALALGLSEKAAESLLTRSRESFRRLLVGKTLAAEILE